MTNALYNVPNHSEIVYVSSLLVAEPVQWPACINFVRIIKFPDLLKICGECHHLCKQL